jgi:hypothetical protein
MFWHHGGFLKEGKVSISRNGEVKRTVARWLGKVCRVRSVSPSRFRLHLAACSRKMRRCKMWDAVYLADLQIIRVTARWKARQVQQGGPAWAVMCSGSLYANGLQAGLCFARRWYLLPTYYLHGTYSHSHSINERKACYVGIEISKICSLPYWITNEKMPKCVKNVVPMGKTRLVRLADVKMGIGFQGSPDVCPRASYVWIWIWDVRITHLVLLRGCATATLSFGGRSRIRLAAADGHEVTAGLGWYVIWKCWRFLGNWEERTGLEIRKRASDRTQESRAMAGSVMILKQS